VSRDAKRLKRIDENIGLIQLKKMSRYDIKNALTKKYMPLSDNIHGPYCMMPPELLHTSGSGLILYMFESLQWQIGGGKIRDDIDKLCILEFTCPQKGKVNMPSPEVQLGMASLMEQNVSWKRERVICIFMEEQVNPLTNNL
jgi:hypothetical protein